METSVKGLPGSNRCWNLPATVVSSLLLVLALLAWCGTSLADGILWEDVGSQVEVDLGNPVRSRRSPDARFSAYLTNLGPDELNGPLRFVVADLTPDTVSLADASGLTEQGEPYLDLPSPPGGLAPGERLGPITLTIAGGGRVIFDLLPRVEQFVILEESLSLQITDPPTLLTVGASPIQVQGTISPVGASLTVNGAPVMHTGGRFEAQVNLEEGLNHIVARAQDGQGAEVTDSVAISMDLTPPYVTIESPVDQQHVSSNRVAVTGLINDIVRGTITEGEVVVTVNGIQAEVSNRTYLARNIPLQLGENPIVVLASDQVGNVGEASIRVWYTPPEDARIEMLAGQGQSAPIRSVLTDPLSVRLVDANGNAAAGKVVVFRVIQGDGVVGVGTPDIGQAVMVTTDALGVATTRFSLGSRAGNGNHRVRAKAVRFGGEVVFHASAEAATGDMISVIAGDNQRGAVDQPLPSPLVVAVTDIGANLIPNAEVEFAISAGGGVFQNGQNAYVTRTDSDGRASAELTLGSSEGLGVHRMVAKLVGTGAFAGFTASGFVAGDPGQTSISGVVLDNQDNPVPGVTVRVEDTNRQAIADNQGQFRISEVPVGPVHLLADGGTATAPGEWPTLSYNLVTVAGVDNPLPAPIYMVKLDTQNAVTVGAEDLDYTLSEIPGFKLTVKTGSVTFPDGTKQGQLSVTPVNANKVPMPPPNGMQPQFIVTIQPAGAVFDPPAPLTLPNVDGHLPGAQVEMYSYDHDLEEFVTIGLGTVSQDGTVIESNPGVGVIKAGWHCGSQPGGAGCAHNCPTCTTCQAPDCICNKVSNPNCNVPCGSGFCGFCEVCNPSTRACERDPNCVPPGDPGDGSCINPCGTCLRCERGNCIADPTCMDDNSDCNGQCGDCEVCRNGDCVPDLRCWDDQHPCDTCPSHLDCVTCENNVCVFNGCGDDGDDDGSCDPSCGTCTHCVNGQCLPNDTCHGDGTCSGSCGHCSVCRNGQCVPDARCDLVDDGPQDDIDDSEPGDEGPTDPIEPGEPTTGGNPVTGEKTTTDLPDDQNRASTAHTTNKAGDPVLMFSGELLVETTDLKIPGRGFDFEFKRTYRSRYESNGVLGHNWEHNHSEKLIFPGNNSQIVIRSNGFSRIDTYERLGGGRFQSPDGFFDELRRNPDGTYTIRNFDGFTSHFSTGGITSPARLLYREDRHGNRMRYVYRDTPLGLSGPLVRVIDTLGRSIDFGYNDSGRLITVTDFSGRRVRFTYDRRGNLVKARTPLVYGTSTGNDFLSGKTTSYEYYHDPFAVFNPQLERLNHNLLAITDPKGQRYLEVAYDTSTSSYSFDRVISQRHGTAQQMNGFTYTRLNENVPAQPYDPLLPRNQTLVTDRNGNRRLLIHNGRGNLLEERLETNRNVNPADPAQFVTRHTYDADGHLLSTTFPEGNRVEYVYDSGNVDRLQQRNLLSVTRFPGSRGADQSQIRTTYTYEPIYNQLRTKVEARGNDPAFTPQNGGATSPGRYATVNFFDYQEGGNTASIASAINRTVTEVSNALTAAGMSMNLGDLNADGTTNQVVGNVIRRVQPTVALLPSSQQAALEGDLSQEIFTDFTYNRFGQLVTEVDPEGNVDDVFYYPEEDPDGDGQRTPNILGLADDTGGYRREIIKDSRMHARRRGSEALSRISNGWRYDPVGNVTETTDGRGNSTRYIVNALNQIERTISEAPFNFEHTFFFDANDNVVREEIQNTDTNGPDLDESVTYTYQYDILDNRIAKTEEVSTSEIITTRYEYDDNENLIQTTLPEGNVIEQVFDERDLVYTRTRGAGSSDASTQTFTYDGNGNLVETVDAQDNDGDGVGEATLQNYDGFDRKIRTRDAVGNVIEISYDPAGNIIREQTFGPNGQMSPVDNSGDGNDLLSETQHRHDELSRRFETNQSLFANTGSVGPEGPLTPNDGKVSTRYEFDRSSRLTRVIDDNLHHQDTVFDGVDRSVREIDHMDNEVRTTYDGNNNVIQVLEIERSPEQLVPDESFVTRTEYDTLDRPTAVVDNLGNRTAYRYDSRNNLIGRTDALGNTTAHRYDGINRKLTDIVDLRTGGDGAGEIDTSNDANSDGRIVRLYGWDKNSRLVSETDDNGNVTRYEYDALDRRTRETFADDTTKQFKFDRDDNLTEYIDQNGSTATYGYDGVNRVVRRDIDRASGIEGTTQQAFEYDGLSRRTRAFDDNNPDIASDDSDVRFHYDSLDRLIAEVQNGVEVASRFDGVGNRVGLTYPNGRQLEMAFDSLDRLASVRDAGNGPDIAAFSYLGPNRVIERAYGNGTRLAFYNDVGYDGVKRVTLMTHEDADMGLVAGYGYAYDKQNNRRYEHDRFLDTADVYQYDSFYRLADTTARVPGSAIAGIVNNQTNNADVAGLVGNINLAYQLDGVGNRTSRDIDSTVTTYSVNAMNEYDAIDGEVQDHDDNGNLINDGRHQYVYDVDNRLLRVMEAGNTALARYTYDALNRRETKRVGGIATTYLYDGARVIEERESNEIATKQFVYGSGIDEVLQLSTGGQTYYYHENSIGSVTALTDADGAVVERYRYSPYGQTSVLALDGVSDIGSSLVDNPFRFTGRRFDSETGIYYYRARFYDPERGRFLQRDPKGYEDGIGLYEYVGGNPVNYVDPYGTEKENKGAGKSDEQVKLVEDPSIPGAIEAGIEGVREWQNDPDRWTWDLIQEFSEFAAETLAEHNLRSRKWDARKFVRTFRNVGGKRVKAGIVKKGAKGTQRLMDKLGPVLRAKKFLEAVRIARAINKAEDIWRLTDSTIKTGWEVYRFSKAYEIGPVEILGVVPTYMRAFMLDQENSSKRRALLHAQASPFVSSNAYGSCDARLGACITP